MSGKIKVSTTCLICGTPIYANKDIDLDKPLYELFEGVAYQIAIIGKDGETEVYGFICKNCYEKIKRGEILCKQYTKSYYSKNIKTNK